MEEEDARKAKAIADRPVGVDFCIENPLDGNLKNIPCIKDLISDYPYTVFVTPTSYCHWGREYRKRTILIHTLKSFCPTPPCPSVPCMDWRVYGNHPDGVTELSQGQRNSLPEHLVDAEIEAWIRDTPHAQRRVFMDIFSGYGSVVRRVREKHPSILTFANDIVCREDNNVELDVTVFGLHGLLVFTFQRFFSDEIDIGKDDILAWARANHVAILFHLSTPCETYSTAAGGSHRNARDATPRSGKAKAHDEMNTVLTHWLRHNSL